jgi:predicted RNase H-like HicB family nuclease
MSRLLARKVQSYQIDLVPEPEGGYTVLVPALPGCVSYGETMDEAVRQAREAIELHLANLAAHKEPAPASQETAPVFSTLIQVSPTHVR